MIPTATRSLAQPIQRVVIYSGHQTKKAFGPYSHNIPKRIRMFEEINTLRSRRGLTSWDISVVEGENLGHALRKTDPRKTLLVFPAGQSTNYDRVFSRNELFHIRHQFLEQGGRAYLNCGSAYWASKKRVYDDVCSENPTIPKRLEKPSNIPLFDGVAVGPLCKFPAPQYKVGFFSDAVEIGNGQNQCTIFLSGGGSFILSPESVQQVRIIARYAREELIRLGKRTIEEQEKWQTASVLVKVGDGAALMSMFHPYYGDRDIDIERYEKAFPNSGTNWKEIHSRLSSEEDRMNFVHDHMLAPLEQMDF